MAQELAARASVELGTAHFKEANEQVRAALERADVVELHRVYAQRYLGCAMPAGKRLEIHGTPGNDMACYMDGGAIEVFGNAQDQIGNTMNAGSIVIHGRCGDAAGYAMRGGEIFVRDGCGWRVGIHMKQYEQKRPTIVIGGDAGSFLGEYMAGGVIVLLGRPGEYLATGMHGGVIYLRSKLDARDVPQGLVLEAVDEADKELLRDLLGRYNDAFADELGAPLADDGEGFWRLRPASSRPYASMYAN
ncbi:glutamate synthase [Adlercreutzia sp. ZJ242]|uniref:GltB/FmdC/FwdC-like GXGXG domain-containing protein n=1 Tax=Adlercreutzia sp. ZJ242 TaxID=2709409 RepID=UPI0013ED5504|nr:glutamate synthase [Adlercreutzia sp. ZJ242]